MADDKPGGDDLFEDLDKFFAPIRDVDWESDEPSPSTAEVPQEEHVAVHAAETPPAPEPAATDDEGEDDEAWYDTGVLEPIDELLGEPAADELGAEEPAGGEPVVIETAPAEDTDQGDLLGEPSAEEEPAVPTIADELDEGSLADETPTEEEIDAAAEHFAGSIPLDDELDEMEVERADEAPVTVSGLFGEEDAGEVEEDILADLEGSEGAQRTVVVGAGGLGGPSWQEPTAIEVGADLDRRGPGEGERDVPAAFLTGLVLAGIALGSLLLPGKGAFAVVAGLVVLVAQGELFGVTVKQHHQPATAVGLVAGALMMAGAYYHGESAVLAMFALGIVATFLWFLAAPAAHRRGTLTNAGLTVANVAYIPLLGTFLIVTLVIDGSDGKALVLAVIGLTFLFDTAAFLAGSVWGGSFIERPLAPNTSPRKSWEGFIVATIVTIFASLALVPSFVAPFEDKRIDAFLLAVVIAAAATLGDLSESLIKRDLGIKDMGSVLPGHGGLLDRIDSLLFVAPAAYLLFRVIFA